MKYYLGIDVGSTVKLYLTDENDKCLFFLSTQDISQMLEKQSMSY